MLKDSADSNLLKGLTPDHRLYMRSGRAAMRTGEKGWASRRASGRRGKRASGIADGGRERAEGLEGGGGNGSGTESFQSLYIYPIINLHMSFLQCGA